MLDPNEKHAFEEMVAQLRTTDPRFDQKLERLGTPPRRPRVILAVVLWILAPVSIYVGGWTGLLMAVIGSTYGVWLVKKKRGFEAAPAVISSRHR